MNNVNAWKIPLNFATEQFQCEGKRLYASFLELQQIPLRKQAFYAEHKMLPSDLYSGNDLCE